VTTADISVASGDARITEVARMLGGDPASRVSQAHARELLESAAPAAGSRLGRAGAGAAAARRRRSA
jgi:DNA repair protein RecN (Recombination protein N)